MNGVSESTTTTGTGDLTTSQITGRPRFTDVFTYNASEASADLFPYAIVTRDSPPQIIEWGKGWMSAVGTLKRQEILGTLVSGTLNVLTPTAASLPAGTKDVIFAPLADFMRPTLPNVDSISSSVTRGLWPAGSVEAGSTGQAVTTVDRCYYYPIYIDVARICTGIFYRQYANAAGTGKLRVGLYSCNRTGYPGRKIAETADIDATTGGNVIKTAAWSGGNVRLPPGWYFIALASNYATTQPSIEYMQSTAFGNTPFGITSGGRTIIGRYEALTGGWSALPNNASATTTLLQSSTNQAYKVGVTIA